MGIPGKSEVESNIKVSQMLENLPPEAWKQQIDELYREHPEGGSAGFLPRHFLESSFPKIGGLLAHHTDGAARFWGMILPGPNREGQGWTVRAHFDNADREFRDQTEMGLTIHLYDLGYGSGSWYDVERKRQDGFFGNTIAAFGEYKLGYASCAQAQTAASLHKELWGVDNPAYVYPYDLYRHDAGTSTRLVATHEDKVVGFLFGFYGRGHQWVGRDEKDYTWIESQLMGIQTEQRRKGLGKQLKLLQRDLALKEHIDLIHWTFDPLQAGNAFLNLNQLGGIAVTFDENYYPFQNNLNRVPASRIGVSWLLTSDRVSSALAGKPIQRGFNDLMADKDTEIIIPLYTLDHNTSWVPKTNVILIQIPTNWSEMQRDHLDKALQWRQATDAIFRKIVGSSDDKYALTGIVKNPEIGSVFLVAEKSPNRLV